MNIALLIEYDGSQFHGFQKQTDTRTIQSALETALTQVAADEVRVACSGRTDSGVHATYQVATFHTDSIRSEDGWIQGTNTHLPADVAVIETMVVPDEFHARFSALSRRYLYVFSEINVVPALGSTLFTRVSTPMDVAAMKTAAIEFLGNHDFSSFRAANCDSKSPCRLITHLEVLRVGSFVVIDIVANAFLLRMVRNIAGALLAVAHGRINAGDIRELLRARDRTLAPPTAPPNGLYLISVGYQESIFSQDVRNPLVLGPMASSFLAKSPLQPSQRFCGVSSQDGPS